MRTLGIIFLFTTMAVGRVDFWAPVNPPRAHYSIEARYVAARFEDGTEQRARTERLADLDELKFQAKSPLKEVVIEPDSAVALADSPLDRRHVFTTKISELPWTGVGEAALDGYQQACELKIEDAFTWLKLGLLLYDGRYYPEALEAMTRV